MEFGTVDRKRFFNERFICLHHVWSWLCRLNQKLVFHYSLKVSTVQEDRQMQFERRAASLHVAFNQF